MPSRNIVKEYVAGGIYHIYNRGVEKRDIFLDDQDYHIFLKYLKDGLSTPPDRTSLLKAVTFKGPTFKGIPRQPKNFNGRIELLAFALMPNHFHLLIRQKDEHGINEFVQSLNTRYVVYFNKRHKRVGTLFQGKYKAILVMEEPYLLHLTRYMHINPREFIKDLTKAYTSYPYYLGLQQAEWIKPKQILSFFSEGTKTLSFLKKTNTYRSFVENEEIDSHAFLGKLTLDASTL